MAAPENWEVLNPCSVEVSPRASVSLNLFEQDSDGGVIIK